MRSIILIIIIIALISLLTFFEKPPVNQYYHEQDQTAVMQEGDHPQKVKKNSKMLYTQSDMDFLIRAYGVALP